jgi:ribosomal protein L7/L12
MGVDRELLEIKQRLALIETRLQQLFEHLDIASRESAGGGWWGGGEEGEALDPAADPEIQDLLAKGNQVQAVKRYRELSGAGLVEAQRAIEQAQQGG